MTEIYSAKDYKVFEIYDDYGMITIYKDLSALFDHKKDFYHGSEPTIRMTEGYYEMVFGEEQECACVMVFTDDKKREEYEELDLGIYECLGYSIRIVEILNEK